MMRKISAPAAAALIIVLSFAGCSQSADDVLDRVLEAGTLTVLVPENGGDYAYLESDGVTWSGPEIELAQGIAEDLGVELSVISAPKEGLLSAFAEGKGDIALGRIADSDSLRSGYAVSRGYASARLFAVTPRGVYFPSAGSLANKAVGVTDQVSDINLIVLNGVTGLSFQRHSGIEQVEDLLVKASIAAYLCYEDQAAALLAESAIQVQNITGFDRESYVAVGNRNAGTLMERVNGTIERLAESGAPEWPSWPE
jgi:ABC-type amino acid transport substrate-binding protein